MIFEQLHLDNGLICSDMRRLSQAFIYCRDDGLNMTWIGHVLCSKLLDEKIVNITVHYDYVCSDHKPLGIEFYNLPVTCGYHQ